jgi:hypothetical protein
MRHVRYTPNDPQFWDFRYISPSFLEKKIHTEPTEIDHKSFSWDEMALYDFPTNINYILQVTGASKISYIGHSEVLVMARTQTQSYIMTQNLLSTVVEDYFFF